MSDHQQQNDPSAQEECTQVGKSADEIMKEQEAQLMAKYGGMKPGKKKGALAQNKEHKFFDSADWALNKEAAAKKGVPAPRQVPEEQLKPKLEPTAAPGRRISHLDSTDHRGLQDEHAQ